MTAREFTLEAVMAIMANSNSTELESITGIPAATWRTHKRNYKRGNMTLDKQIELARKLGFSQSQPIMFVSETSF